ncbi:hypothetical protein [Micromonospora sp. GCM10011541]|uniref:hypothetical protein n=1 Tax=Micromonospora sp. GCM10011541 TaxID=3317336 RepID=UPI003607E67F
MALFNSTPVTTNQPTLEERANAAAATASYARTAFEDAANDLEAAAQLQVEIRDAALAEAEQLNDLALSADDEANRNAEAAQKIRALIA